MSSTYANGRTIIHKGDGLTQTCAPPDVCKTPSPGGPVPVPYVNIAQDGDLQDGSQTVEIEGNPVALASSNLSVSSGNESGTAGGGLISSKTKGKLAWASSSIDVKFEGKGVVRFFDVTLANGNTYNSNFINPGSGTTAWAYGDDQPCAKCRKPAHQHPALHENNRTKDLTQALSARLEARYQQVEGRREHLKQRKSQHDADAKAARGKMQDAQRELSAFEASIKWKKDMQKPADMSTPDWESRSEARADILRRKDIADQEEREHRKVSDELVGQAKKLELPQKFMIGVLECEDGSLYGAMSGVTPLSELDFDDCAQALLLIPCGPVQSAHDRQGSALAGLEGEGQGISPLACAAIKLIEKAQGDGKMPLYMTEQLFTMKKDKKYLTDGYSRTDPTGTRQVSDQDPAGSFSHGETVPSCKNCQLNIPRMLCPETTN